jgi:SAM-dependent methyltransferase
LCEASALLCARSRELRAVSSAQIRPRVALSGPAGHPVSDDREVADEATAHNQAAYDQIAGQYASRRAGRDRSFPELRAALAARLPRVADIADLGCGPGLDGAQFARDGHRVTGVDRSAGMLAHAARALPGRVARGDLRRLPLASRSIDGIWCSASLLHVPHDQTTATLGEMRRILRPGGCLALVTAAGQGARLEPVPYAPDTQRWFFYREPAELDQQLRGAGLAVVTMSEEITSRHWLKILAEVR